MNDRIDDAASGRLGELDRLSGIVHIIRLMPKQKKLDPKTYPLAAKLQKWRKRMAQLKGVPVYTQRMAALDTGIPVDTWGNWEQDRRKPSRLALESLLGKLEEVAVSAASSVETV